MYSSDDLVWAKLQGHDYKVTIFQYHEIIHHMDPEFMWMIHETVYNFIVGIKDNIYRVYDLFNNVAERMCAIIVEREHATNVPDHQEVAYEMLTEYRKFTVNKKDKSPMELVNEFLIYGIKRAIILVRFYNRDPADRRVK